jgi:SpoVK/Ycf46/Vps4 family AAA+-type ATPase
LQAELARIDVLLRREIRRWRLAGQDPTDAFRGLYVSDAQADALLARPFGTNWGQTVALEPEEAQAFAKAQAQAARQVQSLAETARCQGHTPRLEHLAIAFGLDRFEVDTLLICLAPTLDLRYERLYGYLQDDVTRKRASVNLVLDLLCEPDPSTTLRQGSGRGPDRLKTLSHFADDAPLFRYQLLERVPESGGGKPPLLSQTLCPDEAIVAWLLGRYQPHADLSSHATLSHPQGNDADDLLASAQSGSVTRTLCVAEGSGVEWPVVVLYGPDQASQQAVASSLATQIERPLLTVDLAAVTDAGLPPLRALRLALRDACLTSAVPCLTGWDACLADGAPPPELLAELCAYADLAIVAGRAAWQPKGIDRKRHLLWLEFPIPAYAQRYALWEHFLGRETSEVLETLEVSEVTALAGQFQLTAGQIRDAVASAKDLAAQRGEPLERTDLFAAARAHSNPRLSRLARKIVPRYSWQDIVLPDDQLALLREIIATVRGRPVVLEEWGVGQKLASSKGVTVLFSGPPGTGKTMAAEIIAAELGLDLYKIDLSTVVSKYIGETEKNLERIFNEAQTSNAILFFDEADALFGKRSEVRDSHDRYANIEISYLLQRMEAYDGVAILATNLRANLDEAFTRRLQFAVDFPFPDEADRLRIWRTLFPPDVPREPELDLALLAHRFKLAGGNIRNILVSAAFLAAADSGRVTMDHLLHGTRRELQKMGRLIGEEDMVIG